MFWMVLGEKSSETRVRHANMDIAKGEAKRLDASNPGEKFYVLECVGFMQKSDPVAWTDAQLPF